MEKKCSAREVYSDKSLIQWKVFISQLATMLGVWDPRDQDPSEAPSLSQDELLSIKNIFWNNKLHLTDNQKQDYKSQKTRLFIFRDFPQNYRL